MPRARLLGHFSASKHRLECSKCAQLRLARLPCRPPTQSVAVVNRRLNAARQIREINRRVTRMMLVGSDRDEGLLMGIGSICSISRTRITGATCRPRTTASSAEASLISVMGSAETTEETGLSTIANQEALTRVNNQIAADENTLTTSSGSSNAYWFVELLHVIQPLRHRNRNGPAYDQHPALDAGNSAKWHDHRQRWREHNKLIRPPAPTPWAI